MIQAVAHPRHERRNGPVDVPRLVPPLPRARRRNHRDIELNRRDAELQRIQDRIDLIRSSFRQLRSELNSAIREMELSSAPFAHPEHILRRVATILGVAMGINMKSRDHEFVRLRYIAMLILHEQRLSYPQIGRALGGMHHTSVMHGVRRGKDLMVTDARFQGDMGRAKAGLAEGINGRDDLR